MNVIHLIGYETNNSRFNKSIQQQPRGVFINTCGYRTTTTKERLNGLSGVHIQQKNFVWYLNGNKWNGDAVKLEDWGLFTPA